MLTLVGRCQTSAVPRLQRLKHRRRRSFVPSEKGAALEVTALVRAGDRGLSSHACG